MSPHDPHDHDHGHHDDHDHTHPHTHNDQAHNDQGHPILKYSDDSVHDQRDTDRYPLMAEAIRQLVVEKGYVSASDVREHLEALDKIDDGIGGRIVARAWTDPDFKARLLKDGTQAIKEMGVDLSPVQLIVVENTAEVHNLVVCTLCSCYPRGLLGLPPDWYKSKAYRSRAVSEPRSVMREFGTLVPDSVTVRVHDSNADMRYMVLPARPEGTEGWDVDRLAELVSRDSLVGVVRAKQP
jgi:nitrile hydratase